MSDEQQKLSEEEEKGLQQILDDILEIPMFILAMIMLILLVIELALNLDPAWRRIVLTSGSIIWWIFVAEYAFRVLLAEDKLGYIRTHWLDALFIFVPFLRVFRILRVLRALRVIRAIRPAIFLRTFVTTRRGFRQLGAVLGRRNFAYVAAVTLVTLLIGALMMFLLERNAPHTVISSYGSALWFCIGIITTIGNELYPVTAEGRVVAAFLMIFGVGIFGYVAATIASYFIGSDIQNAGTGSSQAQPAQVQDETDKYEELSRKIDRLLEAVEEQKTGEPDNNSNS